MIPLVRDCFTQSDNGDDGDGGHGDFVWEQDSFSDAPARRLETWFICGGSAGAAICTFWEPGFHV